MIPVDQRNNFDCMTACLASIFELRYQQCPTLYMLKTGEPLDAWHTVYDLWLAKRGWAVMERVLVEGQEIDSQESPWSFPGYWIAGVKSPRYDGTHAVVMHKDKIIFDPHPRRYMGHLGFESAAYFLPLDPAKFILREK